MPNFIPSLKAVYVELGRDKLGYTCIIYIAKVNIRTQEDSRSYFSKQGLHILCGMTLVAVDEKKKINKMLVLCVYLLFKFSPFKTLEGEHGSFFFFLMLLHILEEQNFISFIAMRFPLFFFKEFLGEEGINWMESLFFVWW